MDTGKTGTGAAVEVVASTADPVVAALQGLYRAFQKISIYPPGHPAIPRALAETSDHFARALCDGNLLVGVAPDHLLIEDHAMAEASGLTRSLAVLLHDLDVAALEFHEAPSAQQLERLVAGFGRARREGRRGESFVELLADLGVDSPKVIPIDYRALSFADGAREESGESRGDVWESFLVRLSDPSASADPVQLARDVDREIRRHEGVGLGALRGRIRRMNDRLKAIDPELRAAMRQRLADFVKALNPDLRGDLLRVDPQRPAESLSLMTELADAIPEPDLLDALQEIDRVGARVPEQVLTLMNKLVRIAGERPSLASGLEATLHRWGVDPAALQDEAPDLRGALEEVFQSRVAVDCNPESYQALLDELSRSQLGGHRISSESRYRDPRDEFDVRLHAAEIAVQALGFGGGGKHRAALLGVVDQASGALLASGRFDALRDAAVAAQSFSALPEQSDVTRRAARGYLDGFTDRERIRRVLKEACSQSSLPESALSLLRLGGVAALDEALDALQGETRFEIAEALRRLVSDSGPEQVAGLLETRAAGAWPRLRTLLPILRRLRPVDGVPLLERLAAHGDARVRREALEALCDVDRRGGAFERHLARALGDDDETVLLFAAERLAELDSPSARETLAAYLQGALDGEPPTAAVAARVAELLAASGVRGVQRLCACLDGLRWAVRPRRVVVARVIHGVLLAHRELPGVGECLRRWNWAPGARLLGALLLWLHGGTAGTR